MESMICAWTGLTRPECSCASCVRRLILEFAPHSVREGLTEPSAGPDEGELPSIDEDFPPVIERLERPVL